MSDRGTIAIGLCYVEFVLPEGSSLKDKRSVVRGLINRAHAKFNVSVSEVAHGDLWHRCGLAICHVSGSGPFRIRFSPRS